MTRCWVLGWAALAGCSLAGCAGNCTCASSNPFERSASDECMTRLRKLGTAFAQYVNSYDDVTPPAAWADVLKPYYKFDVLIEEPALPSPNFGYAYNSALPVRPEHKIPDQH